MLSIGRPFRITLLMAHQDVPGAAFLFLMKLMPSKDKNEA
jgi:hypothetical protein